MKWDVFVSHAFEDKEFARALAEGLSTKGLSVWFDEFELNVGDSLRRSIDDGLLKSRFGAVVLSPSFFAKEWPQKELDALTAREATGKKIVLPIWHNISAHEISKYSPMLADRFAISSIEGIDKTVENLFLAIKMNTSKHRRTRLQLQEKLEAQLQEAKRLSAVKERELKAVIAQAHEVAHTDELTFLPNRRQIIGDLQREVMFSGRYGTPLTISMLDIDHFHDINDTYGHTVGDEVLQRLAHELRIHLRQPDTIGRHGGETFLIVFPHTIPNAAKEIVEDLCQQVRSIAIQIVHDKKVLHLTISAGITQYKTPEDWRSLLDRADKALYQAKRNGGDHWVIIDS
jgi:diguanylate cyclase (GGDEF)-like protein